MLICFVSKIDEPSGKCGFTSLTTSKYKKPQFPQKLNLRIGLFPFQINGILQMYIFYFGKTGTQSSCRGLCFGP